jgi:hypothetical protein
MRPGGQCRRDGQCRRRMPLSGRCCTTGRGRQRRWAGLRLVRIGRSRRRHCRLRGRTRRNRPGRTIFLMLLPPVPSCHRRHFRHHPDPTCAFVTGKRRISGGILRGLGQRRRCQLSSTWCTLRRPGWRGAAVIHGRRADRHRRLRHGLARRNHSAASQGRQRRNTHSRRSQNRLALRTGATLPGITR